jgi:hypothetical protein
MSKFGQICFDENGGLTALLHRTDYFGGVHNPVLADGKVYYKSALSTTSTLSVLDEEIPARAAKQPSLITVPLKQENWNRERLALAGFAPPDHAAIPDTFTMNQWEPYYTINQLGHHFNPLNLWFPLPYFGNFLSESMVFADYGTEFRGFGGFFYMSDPFDSNLIFMQAYYDWKYSIVPIDITWMNFSFGLPLYFYYSDKISVSPPGSTDTRVIRPMLYLYFRFPLIDNRLELHIRPGLQATYMFDAPRPTKSTDTVIPGGTAYTWERSQRGFYFFNMGVILSTLDTWQWQIFGNGFSEAGYIHVWLGGDTLTPSYENVLTLAIEPFPFINISGMRQTLYGTYWDTKYPRMPIQGDSLLTETYFSKVSLSAYKTPLPSTLNWVVGG